MASTDLALGRPRILFIDAYDSFANNIIALLKTKLEEFVEIEVTVIRIDAYIPDFLNFLKGFDAVVAGPGPGDPRDAKDVGWMRQLWSLQGADLLPVLGICLGFQSLVLAFGGMVDQLPDPRHGIETCIGHNNSHIFYGLDEIRAVQYHSFHASLHHVMPQEPVDMFPDYLFQSTIYCPDLLPLAWDTTHNQWAAGYGRNPRFILMAVSHADWKKPFCGIQFHPESISSSEQAQRVVKHWWLMAKHWIQECGANRERAAQLKAHENFCATQEMLRGMLRPEPDLQILHEDYDHPLLNRSPSRVKCLTKTISGTARVLSVPAICDLLGIHAGDCIVLDSEVKAMQDAATEGQGANTGTHSIIGIIEPDTTRIEYQVGNSLVYLRKNGVLSCKDLAPHGCSIFTFLKNFMAYHKLQASEADILPVPFRGGLMGYITYEGCLETIGVNGIYEWYPTEPPSHPRPDVCFAFVARSIVVDHQSNNIYIQSIKTMDQEWLNYVHGMLMQSYLPSPHCTELMQAYGVSGTEQQHRDKINQYVSLMNKNNDPRRLYEAYESRMLASQREILRGLSYELCVTDQATLIMPSLKDSSVYQPCAERHPARFGRSRWDASPVDWSVYLRLRKINAAPFSAYVRLGPLTLLSTSPERFMSWDRPHVGFDKDGTYAVVQNCQFRPIKGTVRKSYPDGTQVTLEEATRKLATQKERAENLMIVDLIRHDLHGVVGAGNVNVSQLMAVEEYATVYQLVSVVEGKLFSTKAPGKTGIDVLAASLPPGSMTGAPKLRSCQLLKRFDGNPPRSVYSGVLGYMCVSGGGDFSVVIRSMFKWDGDVGAGMDAWHVGAGGAITSLSTPWAEWEEFKVKLQSTLDVFQEAYEMREQVPMDEEREAARAAYEERKLEADVLAAVQNWMRIREEVEAAGRELREGPDEWEVR